MELSVSLEAICRLIVRARELEAQIPAENDEEDEPEDSDDDSAMLEDEANGIVQTEILAALDDMGEDQVAEVLALAWIGRGTYDPSEWEEALEEAQDGGAQAAIDQILELPMLAAYLEAGLAAFDLSCDGIGQID